MALIGGPDVFFAARFKERLDSLNTLERNLDIAALVYPLKDFQGDPLRLDIATLVDNREGSVEVQLPARFDQKVGSIWFGQPGKAQVRLIGRPHRLLVATNSDLTKQPRGFTKVVLQRTDNMLAGMNKFMWGANWWMPANCPGLFENANFEGKKIVVNDMKWFGSAGVTLIPSLAGMAVGNDKISSIYLPPLGMENPLGHFWMEIFRDDNYRGERMQVYDSIADLEDIGWNDTVSSVKIYRWTDRVKLR